MAGNGFRALPEKVRPLVAYPSSSWSTFVGAGEQVPVVRGRRMNSPELCVNVYWEVLGFFSQASES